MATRKNPRGSSQRRTTNSFVPFLLGFLCAAALAAGGWFYLKHPQHPATLTSTATPEPTRHAPAHPALPPAHPLPQPPFGISEDVFEAGATLYAKSCSSCHGTPAHDAAMNAKSLQLWKKHPASPAVGVSSLPPGEIFNKIKFGAPATGMPAYQHLYTDLQIWQLALLLHNADQPLPDPVTQRLNR